MTPRVTVVIPCRNESPALARCLDALEAQDLPSREFEVIVVDGQSTDGCGAMVVGRGLRLLRDPGRGPAAARNVGIHAARGALVAFTDADCVPRFDWLTRIVAAFDADPAAGAVAGGLRLPRDTLVGRLEDNDARVHYRGYITSNIVYRRDVLLEVGGFDETLVCAEDYDLAWRVLDAGHRIVHDLDAIVQHEPPEVHGSLAAYLRKQLWYARRDVPAHALAIQRSRGSTTRLVGSRQALAGIGGAAKRAAWAAAAGVGVLARSPLVVATALGGAAAVSARHAARGVAEVGSDAGEVARLAAVQTAKLLVRGVGTMVGLADLARPASIRALRRVGPSSASAVARARPAWAPSVA